jgi:hypothetical protein
MVLSVGHPAAIVNGTKVPVNGLIRADRGLASRNKCKRSNAVGDYMATWLEANAGTSKGVASIQKTKETSILSDD